MVSIYNSSCSLKIALLSDTHNIPCNSVLETLRRFQPDIITITGDFLYSITPYSKDAYSVDAESRLSTCPNALTLLNECPSIAPTFVSFGNHEWMLTDIDVKLIFNTGCIVLDNTYVKFPANNQNFYIGGMTSQWFTTVQRYSNAYIPPCNYEDNINRIGFVTKSKVSTEYEKLYSWMDDFEKEDGYKIILSHHPQHWCLLPPLLESRHFDLVLTGHAHGGLIRYFNPFKHLWCGIISPDEGLFPKYTEGVHKGRYGSMIISRGLANTSKLPRLFNPCELVIIEP